MTRMSIAVLLIVSVACSKSEKTDNGKATSGGGGAAKASGPYAEFGATPSFEGAWVVTGASLGGKEVWNVQGNQLTIFDGTAEKKREIKVVNPCTIGVIENAGGGTSTEYHKFVWEGQTLHLGLGAAGIRKGTSVIACGMETFVLRDGKCAMHREMFGKMEEKPAECSIVKEGEQEIFQAKNPTFPDMSPDNIPIHGDVLMSDQMKGNLAEKAASYDEAKAKLAAK